MRIDGRVLGAAVREVRRQNDSNKQAGADPIMDWRDVSLDVTAKLADQASLLDSDPEAFRAQLEATTRECVASDQERWRRYQTQRVRRRLR